MNGSAANPPWQQGFDFSVPGQHIKSGLTPPSMAGNVPSPLSNAMMFDQYRPQQGAILTVHPTPLKSRVETQIPIKMTLFPVPPGITKLHLPTHTISKPKLLAKPAHERSADTLELYTMLVCSSAMQTPEFRERAFAKARAATTIQSQQASPKSSEGSADDDDENKPLNGGEVKICSGCVTRERKRAARKKVKKVEEEESWHKDEQRRVIVFNTHEIKEWQQPTSQVPSESTGDRMEPPVPEGALQVDAPMRIACYCRHQNEKIGFQVILTIKDCHDRFIAQTMTSSIMITDDHKTHNMPNMPLGAGVLDGQMYGVGMPFMPPEVPMDPQAFRHSQSVPNLQAMQANFTMPPNIYAPPAQPQPAPMSGVTTSMSSQNTSATMTPRNLSRQGSPTGGAGPSSKKRKSSGSGKVPSGLAMTRLETAPAAPGAMPSGQTSASAGTSPFLPNMNTFQLTDTSFVIPPNSIPPQAGPYNTGPPTPNSNDQFFGAANRSHSMENLAMQQLYSAPASAHQSRAPSPSSGARNSIQAYQQQQQAQMAQALASGLYGMPLPLDPRRPPTIHKIIPNEGPKAGGIEVTCLGSGFCQGLDVMFGDVKATTTTYWGETSLVCLLPPAMAGGIVPVTFKHQHQQQLQMQPFSAASLPKATVTFKYIDDDEQQLIRLALSVLGQKMNGKMEDVRDLARRIVGNGDSSWAAPGHSPPGGHQQASNFNAVTFGVDIESTLLRCLDLVDLDDSPRMPRLNMRTSSNQTMLHLACSLGLNRFVAALLARGANPEPRDKNGFNPMHFAAMHDHPQIVRRLILSGADPTMRTFQGFTPADLATSPEVLQSTRRFQHHTRTRSAGSMKSRNSSAASLRSLWEGPSMTPVNSHPIISNDEDTSDEDADEDEYDDEDGDADQDDAFWMKSKSKAASRRPSAQVTAELMPKNSSLLELPVARVHDENVSPTVAALSAFRDQLSAQIAHLQHSMHLNLPQMPNLPDYQAYLPTSSPMVRRISSMVPTIARPGSGDQATAGGEYKWWDLFSNNSPASPPAYEEIYPDAEISQAEQKRSSAQRAAADTVADQKCAELFNQTAVATSSKTNAGAEVLQTLRIGKKSSITREQQEQLRQAHAEKVKRFRSDRNLFFIWIPLLVVIVFAMLYNRMPQMWYVASDITDMIRSYGRVIEV